MSRCICPKMLLDEEHETIVRVDGACPEHGYPRDEWHAGDPLRRHALEIDRETGELVTAQEAHDRLREPGEFAVDCVAYMRRFRTERPSEVCERLLKEAAA